MTRRFAAKEPGVTGQTATEGETVRCSPAICLPKFVGRDRELSALATALAGARAVVLIEGEAGMGKTRLVGEYVASSAAAGVTALVACCPPFRQPHTLGPVVDAFRQAAAPRGMRDIVLSPLAGALRPLFPEWATDLPPGPDPLEDASSVPSLHRVFSALAELLDRLGTGLLIAEDVHWADDATLEFLLFLVSRKPPAVNLLVTYRPEEVPDSSLVRRLSRLSACDCGLRLALPPLDIEAAGSLVSSMLAGEKVSAEFAAFLHDRTEGVPLAREESVRVMGDRAELVIRDGAWMRRPLGDSRSRPRCGMRCSSGPVGFAAAPRVFSGRPRCSPLQPPRTLWPELLGLLAKPPSEECRRP